MIQTLLKEKGAKIVQKIQNPSYTIDALSPETYLGYERMGSFASPETPVADKEATYSLPDSLPLNSFAIEGSWTVGGQMAMPTSGSVLEYHFNAKDVYLVLNSKNGNSKINVFLDGMPVDGNNEGKDVENGSATISANRLYHLIHLEKGEEHILRIEFLDNNISAFAFTFG
jgi:hypothetical protein